MALELLALNVTFWVDSVLVPETWGVAMPTHHPSMA